VSARRTPLTAQRVFATAVAIADAEGITAVTMRRVASELDVEAMSLYHHVANKDALLDGMVDAVFAEIELPHARGKWVNAMTRRAESQRAALLRHRWAVGLLESRTSPGPALLRHHDAFIGRCRSAGFSVEMTAHAFAALDCYVFGFVLQEVNLPIDADTDYGAAATEILPDDLADSFPHFAEFVAEVVARPGYSFGREFGYGLSLLLRALEEEALR